MANEPCPVLHLSGRSEAVSRSLLNAGQFGDRGQFVALRRSK